MSVTRIAQHGIIDYDNPLSFTWDGRQYQGFQGDSLAAALLANNQHIIARSFKYHRPRSVMSCGVEESGAIVTLGTGAHKKVNIAATTQPLYDGLAAFGQNAFPNVERDIGAVNNILGRFFAAGFYYKTFMGLPPFEWGRGTKIWMWYEKIIRQAAGMGTASRLPDPDIYDHAHGYCDVMVVGGGIAGLETALALADKNMDVMLVEQDWQLGGTSWSNNSDHALLHEKIAQVSNHANIRLMTRTTAFGLYDNGTMGLCEHVHDTPSISFNYLMPAMRLWTIRARHIVMATGAIERHIAFNNNDIPGVMSNNAAHLYLNRYGLLLGQHICVATNNDSAYEAALDYAKHGAKVTIIDARDAISDHLRQKVDDADIALFYNSAPCQNNGHRFITSVDIARHIDSNNWQYYHNIACDRLCLAYGFSPVIHLLSHRNLKPIWDNDHACFIIPHDRMEGNLSAVGSLMATWHIDDIIHNAHQEASKINAILRNKKPKNVHYAVSPSNNAIKPLYHVPHPKLKKQFVDPLHDVTAADIALAHREGYIAVEHLKRYTTLGMASDQGKMGNIIGMALMGDALGKNIQDVGITTFRPPYTPIAIGALKGRNVGHHFRPLRRTPMHDWNLQHHAVMTEAGLWQRPWYYPKHNETFNDAYIREATCVRQKVGVCDVTSLGKIAVQGPDAGIFLDRVYTNMFSTLKIGKARYGIMLRDDGFVMDDGTTWRLAEHEYFMTTTTAHAAKVMAWCEELLQTRMQDLNVHVTSVTDQWAAIAIAGPLSRELLQDIMHDPTVVSNDNLPFMGVIETAIQGRVPCRIARISFSGERAFELYVEAGYGDYMMALVDAHIHKYDGCYYGLEALGTLRIEKGHVTGAELDGRVTIEDAGLGGMASKKKAYIGSVLKNRPELCRDDRPQLVGIIPCDITKTFKAGSILWHDSAPNDGHGIGWITAVTYSPEFKHWIGIGFIRGGHQAWQNTVTAQDPLHNNACEVRVISPHMVDPKGERMHG